MYIEIYPSYDSNTTINIMEVGPSGVVAAGIRLTQGKLEPRLQVVCQVAVGVRKTGVDWTNLTETELGTKKDYTNKPGLVSPSKETKETEKKYKILIRIKTKKYHGNEEIMMMARKYDKVEKAKNG